MPLEEFLARQDPQLRPIFEAVVPMLEAIGPLVIDAVGVGLFAKASRNFAEFRHKRERVQVWFRLSRALESPRLRRTVREGTRGHSCYLDLRAVADVDEELAGWLREAYFESVR
jgi:hypothetical protein